MEQTILSSTLYLYSLDELILTLEKDRSEVTRVIGNTSTGLPSYSKAPGLNLQ